MRETPFWRKPEPLPIPPFLLSDPTENLTDLEIGRYFRLDPDDIEKIEREAAAPEDKVPMAFEYCCQRSFRRTPPPSRPIRPRIARHLADQLGVDVGIALEHTAGARKRWRMRGTVMVLLDLRPFDENARADLRAWLIEQVHLNDDPEHLKIYLYQKLLNDNIRFPAPYALKRLLGECRKEAERIMTETIHSQLTFEQKKALNGLLKIKEETGKPHLEWLKRPPVGTGTQTLMAVLEKIEFIRRLGIDDVNEKVIGINPRLRMAEETRWRDTQALSDLSTPKRMMYLICFLKAKLQVLHDQAGEFFQNVVTGITHRTVRSYETRVSEAAALIRKELRVLLKGAVLLVDPKLAGQDLQKVLRKKVQVERYNTALALCESFASDDDQIYFKALLARYPTTSPFFRRFITVLTFRPMRQTEPSPVLPAIEAFKTFLSGGAMPESAVDLPTDFVPKSSRDAVIRTEDGIHLPLWEMCLLERLKQELKSGHIYIEGGQKYGDISDLQHSDEKWAEIRDDVYEDLELTKDGQLAARHIHDGVIERAERFNRELPTNPYVTRKGNRLSLTPLDEEKEPDSVKGLEKQFKSRLKKIGLPEMFQTVNGWTGFSKCFHSTKPRQADLPDIVTRVYLIIMAEATNMELAKIAEHTPGMTYEKLAEVKDLYFQKDNIAAALKTLIRTKHALPISEYFGERDIAVSDGQRYIVNARVPHAGSYPRRFGGRKRVLSMYTHMTQEWTPFHVNLIRPAEEIPYVLDGLFHNQVGIEPKFHITDTGGFAHRIFGLLRMASRNYIPRLKNLPHQKWFYPPGVEPPKEIRFLFDKQRLDTDLIAREWDNLVRLVASMMLHATSCTAIAQRMNAPKSVLPVFEALLEVGRADKTCFMMDFYSDLQLRRIINRGNTRINSMHDFMKYIRHGQAGEFQDRDYDRQMIEASCLLIFLNIWELYNEVMFTEILKQLTREGIPFNYGDLFHISPLLHEHVNIYGDYRFEPERPVDQAIFERAKSLKP